MMVYSYGDESSHDSQSNRSINSRSNSSSSRQFSQPLEMLPSSQVTLLSSTTIKATQTNNAIKTVSKAKSSPLYLVIDSSVFNTSHNINDLIHKEFLHIQDISITKNGMICREASASYDRHHSHHNEYYVDLVHSDDETVSFTQSSTNNPPLPPPTSSTIINTSNNQSERYEFFTIDRGDSMIRWTRQPLHHIVHDNGSHGSNSSSSSSSSIITFEPYSMQLVDNDSFIDLVLQSSDGVEFDALLHHFNHSDTRSASSSSRWSGVGIHSDDNSRDRYDDNDTVASAVAGNNDKERFMIVLVGIDKSAFNRQKKVFNPYIVINNSMIIITLLLITIIFIIVISSCVCKVDIEK